MSSTRHILIRELMKIIRFGIVGGLATLVHILVVIWISYRSDTHPIVTNTIAFCVAFIVSALGHTHFSFRLRSGRLQATIKFLVTALSGIVFSNLVLALCLHLVTPSLAQAIAIIIVPVYVFLLSRFWAFKS